MNILAFCSSLVCLITTIDVKRKNKLINPSTIFYALWTFILFLSILNLYGIYKPSDEAYLLIMIMIVSFYLGNLIFKIIKEKFLNSCIKNNEKNKKYYLLDKVFLFLGFSVRFRFNYNYKTIGRWNSYVANKKLDIRTGWI